MGDVNLEIKLGNLDERVIKIEESGGGSGGDGYITSVSNDFNVVNKKLSLSNNVTTKLSKVDDKIDKPASATNGQVLTYNGTSNEWEAQDSKGGADDTSIISDAYDELKTYVAGEYCIYNNLLWKCLVQNNGQTPTEGTYWTNVTVANEISSVNSSLSDVLSKTKIKTVAYKQSTDVNGGSVLYADESKTTKLNPSHHIILSVGGTLENGQGFFNLVSPRVSDYLVKAISASSGSSLTSLTNTNINWKVTYLELN